MWRDTNSCSHTANFCISLGDLQLISTTALVWADYGLQKEPHLILMRTSMMNASWGLGLNCSAILRSGQYHHRENAYSGWMGWPELGSQQFPEQLHTVWKRTGHLGRVSSSKRAKRIEGAQRASFQLMITIPDLIPIVRNTLDRHPYISEKMLKEQFESLIYLPLLEIRQRSTDIMVVVIDALDECNREDDVQLILRLLPQVQKSNQYDFVFYWQADLSYQ